MALPATDAFTGTTGNNLTTYSSNWTIIYGNFQIQTNQIVVNGPAANETSGAYWNADTFSSKHYAKMTIPNKNAIGSVIGVCVRGQASGFYYCFYDPQANQVFLGEANNAGNATDWGAHGSITAGDVIEFAVDSYDSNTFHYKKNGVLIATYSGKTTLSGGKPGLSGYGLLNSPNWQYGDNWEAGNVPDYQATVVTGILTEPVSAGSDQTVTGLPFKPKLVLFYPFRSTSQNGDEGFNTWLGFGAATSSSNRFTFAVAGVQGASTNSVASKPDACIVVNDWAPSHTILDLADFVSMNSDGFTIHWTTCAGTQLTISWVAIGGGLINAKVGQETMKTSTGTKATTGVGFKPDAMLVFSNCLSVATSVDANTVTNGCLGIANGANQASSSFYDPGDGTACSCAQDTSNVLAFYNASAAVAKASLSTFDSDGFTLNYSTAPGSAYYFFWIAIQGLKTRVGSISAFSATGTQTITGLGFKPALGLFQTFGYAATSSLKTDCRFTMGMGKGGPISAHKQLLNYYGAGTSNLRCRAEWRELCISTCIPNSVQPTTEMDSEFMNLDADGFSFNVVTADATARQMLYLALGEVDAQPQLDLTSDLNKKTVLTRP